MDYKLQNFSNGNTLNDINLNYIEKGILDLYNASFISNNCVNKPYVFKDKKIYFFGDSITFGYVSGHRAENGGYPKVFSDRVGATFQNHGVSGSLFGSYNNLGRIQDKVMSKTLDCDYIFIAGGINDWQCGTPLDIFRTEVTTMCEHIKNNFTGTDVIFITPINHSGRKPIVTPVAEVQEYRDILTEIALTFGFSVIQGNKFPFPTINSAESYKTAMFCDNLHPSELGYEMYAKSLITALC